MRVDRGKTKAWSHAAVLLVGPRVNKIRLTNLDYRHIIGAKDETLLKSQHVIGVFLPREDAILTLVPGQAAAIQGGDPGLAAQQIGLQSYGGGPGEARVQLGFPAAAWSA